MRRLTASASTSDLPASSAASVCATTSSGFDFGAFTSRTMSVSMKAGMPAPATCVFCPRSSLRSPLLSDHAADFDAQ